MINSRRRALLKNALKRPSRLPEEYQEVEWLKATGNQWCKTNYYPEYSANKRIGIKGDLTLLSGNVSDGTIGANFDSNGRKTFGVMARQYIVYVHFGRDYADMKGINLPEWQQVQSSFDIHYEIINNNIILNDSIETITRIGYTSNVPIMIGTFGSGGVYYSENVLYKAFSIYDSDTLLTDIVPCYRKSDGKPGFYQMNVPEGGTNFITNLGSGSDFLIGPEV